MLSIDYVYAQRRTRHKPNSALMTEGKPKSHTKQSSDTDTSDEEQVNPVLITSEEERHYRTIPGTALATQTALSHSRAQANPTVKRGPSCVMTWKNSRVPNFLFPLTKYINYF